MVGAWAFWLYFVAPVTPLMAGDLAVSLQLAGVTSLVVAVGLVVSGIVGPPAVRRLGRGGAAIASASTLAVAAAALAVAPVFWAVLASVGVCALAGATLMNVSTATLSERHQAAAPTAITEGQAVAGWLGVLAPLFVGGMVAVGLGWRGAAMCVAVVPAVLAAGLVPLRAAIGRRPEPPTPAPRGASRERRPAPPRAFPAAFWWSLVGVVVESGSEFCLNFWGSVLVAGNTGVELATATSGLGAFVGGIAVGRTFGSALTRRFRPRPLLLASLGLAAVGFVTVWRSPSLTLAVVALAVTGLGLALVFPLTVALAMRAADDRNDQAAAIVAIVVGVSIGAAPFLLAALSGWLTVAQAFLIVPCLLVVGAVAVGFATKRQPTIDASTAQPEA